MVEFCFVMWFTNILCYGWGVMKELPNWPVALTFTFNIHKDTSTVHFRHDSQNTLHSMWINTLLTLQINTCLCSKIACKWSKIWQKGLDSKFW